MIIEGEITPLKTERPTKNKSIPMNLAVYEIPLPEDLLVSLGNTPSKFKITLSYFIEPNLNVKGNEIKNRYHSIGLAFEVNNPGESKSNFISRISNIEELDGLHLDYPMIIKPSDSGGSKGVRLVNNEKELNLRD